MTRAGQCPAPGMPLPWSDEEIAVAAFRLKAHGFTEDQAEHTLHRFAAEGVRSVRRLVGSLPADRLAELREDQQRYQDARGLDRRGDLMRVRSIARWPWRTSTSQTFGGAVA